MIQSNVRAGPSSTGIEITLSDPSLADRAVVIINSVPGVTMACEEDGHIRATLSGPIASPVLEALIKNGLGVEEAVRRKRTLEEIYLEVVREAGGMQDGQITTNVPGKGSVAE